MLLCLRNPCEALCQKLKLNVDETEPTMYCICGSFIRLNYYDLLLSAFGGASLAYGKVMKQETKLQEEDSSTGPAQMDLLRKMLRICYFDHLKVLENSVANSI